MNSENEHNSRDAWTREANAVRDDAIGFCQAAKQELACLSEALFRVASCDIARLDTSQMLESKDVGSVGSPTRKADKDYIEPSARLRDIKEQLMARIRDGRHARSCAPAEKGVLANE